MQTLPSVIKSLVEQVVTDYVVGGRYGGVPISHDIMRAEYVIYNATVEGAMQLGGWYFRFVKLATLPTAQEADSVEWRTVDLMNDLHFSHTCISDAIADLAGALASKQLSVEKMTALVSSFGNDKARHTFEQAKSVVL